MIKGWTWKKDGTLGSFCDRIEGGKLYRGDTYFSIADLKKSGAEIVPMVAVVIPEPEDRRCALRCKFLQLRNQDDLSGDENMDECFLDFGVYCGGGDEDVHIKPGSDCPAWRGAK